MELFDTDALRDAFLAHAATLPSVYFVASERISFESWFRAELAAMLVTLGHARESIEFKWRYPATKNPADIAVAGDGRIAFELKCLVSGADSKKKQEFPKQTTRLVEKVRNGDLLQGIAFATFIGYSDRSVETLLGKFFSDAWRLSKLRPLVEGQPLVFVIAETH